LDLTYKRLTHFAIFDLSPKERALKTCVFLNISKNMTNPYPFSLPFGEGRGGVLLYTNITYYFSDVNTKILTLETPPFPPQRRGYILNKKPRPSYLDRALIKMKKLFFTSTKPFSLPRQNLALSLSKGHPLLFCKNKHQKQDLSH
jgi:hypothetical protein